MQYLYRAYGPQHQLLYVGITGNWSERFHSHERNSEWMELTDFVKIERFDTRREVEWAERRAIKTELPIYNKQFSVTFDSKPFHFKKLRSWVFYEDVVDELHRPLVDLMSAELLGLPPHIPVNRHKSIYAAYAFVRTVDWARLDLNPPLVCRNCDALAVDRQTQNWHRDALSRVEEATRGERY